MNCTRGFYWISVLKANFKLYYCMTILVVITSDRASLDYTAVVIDCWLVQVKYKLKY